MAIIITKNSSTASAVPTTADLVQGELAVNVTDKRIYTENASTQIVELGTNPSTVTTGTATVTGTLTANGTFASSNAVITGGTINSVPIGASTASTVRGTTVTATTGFVGGLTGNVTGNVTGNLTGGVTGNVIGNLTGNVTASSGTTTLNNLIVNGTADFTSTKLVNVSTPISGTDAANKDYVDTSVAAVIDSAPAALDTLNELAAALGDDANFASTVTTSLAGKLSLTGGTMSGSIAMGSSKVTGLGAPSASGDAATKGYVDTQDGTKLSLTGGTMSGAIAMGTNKITGVGDPTDNQDAATKFYVDDILGSATSAAASAAAAAISESNAATSESNAASSASDAATSASDAASAGAEAIIKYDEFDDRYLGSKSSSPSVDNDGDALLTGALYWDTTAEEMRVYTGTGWTAAGSAINGTSSRTVYTATASQTTFAITYDVGYVDVYLNGSKLAVGTDFTATSGTDVVLTVGATSGDIVDLVAYGAFNVANTYTQAEADAKFATIATTQTLTNKTVEALILNNGYTEETYTLTGTELNPINGSMQAAVLSGNITFTDGLASGQSMMLMLENGSTYSVTWPTMTWATSSGNTPPTLTAADAITFWKIGSTLYGAYVGGYA